MPLVSEAQWAEYKRLRRLAGYPDDQFPSEVKGCPACSYPFADLIEKPEDCLRGVACPMLVRPACDTAWDRVQRLEARVTLLEAERPPHCGKPGLDGFTCRLLPSGHGDDHWFARVDLSYK